MLRTLDWVTQSTQATRTLDSAPGLFLDLSLVATDSREVVLGGVYVARRGEKADGHDYCEEAVRRGASALIVEQPQPSLSVPQIVVSDSTAALGLLAKSHLQALRCEQQADEGALQAVVGITGSAGKTTTKDLLSTILGSFGPTVAPKSSFNNEVGCPLTVLKANLTTRFLVLEMGASAPGDLRYLTDIAPLDVAVVLMAGRAHLGGFGGIPELAAAKAELLEGLREQGTAVLNWDDLAVRQMRGKASRVLTFSAAGSQEASVRAKDVSIGDNGTPEFMLFTEVDAKAVACPVETELVGAHQVSNILAAVTSALAVGLEPARTIQAAQSYSAKSPHRMSVHHLLVPTDEDGLFTLVDDSYNANPDSMRAGIQTARKIARDGRLVLVLGEMLELGPKSSELHREVGSIALAAKADLVIELTAQDSYQLKEDDRVETLRTSNPMEALKLLSRNLRPGDTVLVKGSNGSGSWRVAEALLGGESDASGERKEAMVNAE